MKVIQPHLNGLTLIALNSQVHAQGELDAEQTANPAALIKTCFDSAPALAVCYFDYGIRFAKWENGALHFANEEFPGAPYLQEARIFDRDRELRIWREERALLYRFRVDAAGESHLAMEAEQNLWGTHAEPLPRGWTRLWEDRGTELTAPLVIAEKKNYAGPLAYLKTRNYIDYLKNGQATYVDCRFVGIAEGRAHGA